MNIGIPSDFSLKNAYDARKAGVSVESHRNEEKPGTSVSGPRPKSRALKAGVPIAFASAFDFAALGSQVAKRSKEGRHGATLVMSFRNHPGIGRLINDIRMITDKYPSCPFKCQDNPHITLASLYSGLRRDDSEVHAQRVARNEDRILESARELLKGNSIALKEISLRADGALALVFEITKDPRPYRKQIYDMGAVDSRPGRACMHMVLGNFTAHSSLNPEEKRDLRGRLERFVDSQSDRANGGIRRIDISGAAVELAHFSSASLDKGATRLAGVAGNFLEPGEDSVHGDYLRKRNNQLK